MRESVLRTILLAACPLCGAQVGEPCMSAKGKPWIGDTHYARRQAARTPRMNRNKDRKEHARRRLEILEQLWAALKNEDKRALTDAIELLREDDQVEEPELRARAMIEKERASGERERADMP